MMENPIMVVIFYCVVLFIAMYFFSIRPTRKREMKLAEMRNSVEIGDMVVTNSGMFGKVVDITAECMIIEFGTNKGVRIPVMKYEIYGKKEPNLTNKVEEVPAPERKKGLGGLFGKKQEEEK
ncbi:MAG: preprotein translocase subunit YajC [Epulopiscium sp.]|nr:preprotein translocase subunit YajC [Candidatus Epulonipiscium sp.]